MRAREAIPIALLITLIIALTGCAGPGETDSPKPAQLMPGTSIAAEHATSLVANAFWTLSGPPTPGALVARDCVRTRCARGAGAGVTVEKAATHCPVGAGTLDGSVSVSAENVPELTGCATASGPAAFSRWPPAAGHVVLAIGQPAHSTSVAESPPERPYRHTRRATGDAIGSWGTVKLAFNGTPEVTMEVEQRMKMTSFQKRPFRGAFLVRSAPGFTMRIERFADFSPRVFNGALTLTDTSRGTRFTVTADNVVYLKSVCCHPASGSFSISPDDRDGAGDYRLQFSEACGEARLRDPLGRTQVLRLPDCAS